MKFKIVVIAAAKSDLREIFRYVELNDSYCDEHDY